MTENERKCKTCKTFRVKSEVRDRERGKCENPKVNEMISLSTMDLFFENKLKLSTKEYKQIEKDFKDYQTLVFDGEFGCIFWDGE